MGVAGKNARPHSSSVVMAGLVPAIHVFLLLPKKTWMPGTSPGMTADGGGGLREQFEIPSPLVLSARRQARVEGPEAALTARPAPSPSTQAPRPERRMAASRDGLRSGRGEFGCPPRGRDHRLAWSRIKYLAGTPSMPTKCTAIPLSFRLNIRDS